MDNQSSKTEEPEPGSRGSATKILVDTSFLFDQYQSRGIGVYGKQVLRRLIPLILENPNWDVRIIGFNELESNLIQLGISPFLLDEIKGKIRFYSIGEPNLSGARNITRWRKQYLPIIEKVKPDIYFAVHFERGLPSARFISRGLKHKPKTLVATHDAIPLVLNQFSSKSRLHNFIKKQFYKLMWQGVQGADLVLTPSSFSKNDLIKFGVDEEKIKVVYLGVDPGFFRENNRFEEFDIEEILARFELKDEKYFFYDAGLEENKGISELLSIFKRITEFKSDKLPKKLVIVGKDFKKGVGKSIVAKTILARKFIKKAQNIGILENIVTTGRLTDEELKVLLFKALSYINMSQYEGFSFGPVQAMAAGVPSIASNTSCTPEVTDGGALLVDVTDIELASKKIKNYLEHENEKQRLISTGIEVAKRYDWDKTVDITWDLIQKLAVG